MPKKFTIEEVRAKFASLGKELISTEYENIETALEYKCSCGEIMTASLSGLKLGKRTCKKCCKKTGKAHTYEEVKDMFSNMGRELLSTTYKTMKDKLDYRCECGEIASCNLKSLQRKYNSCKKCSTNPYNERFTIEEVRAKFKEKNKELLENIYINQHQSLKYRCKCGNESSICMKKLTDNVESCDNCRPEVKEKNVMEKYGVSHVTQSEIFKEKRKNTLLERYGVETPMLNKDILKKRDNTNIERYGKANVFQVLEFIEKARKTMINKYGVPYGMQNKEIKEQQEKTMLEKYGSKYFFNTSEFKEKTKQTLIKKYGVEKIHDIPGFSEKAGNHLKNYVMKKYGLINISQVPEIRQKIIKSVYDRYGVDHVMKVPKFFKKQQSSSFKYKTFIFPSGKKIEYQGYEHFALQHLLDMEIPEEEILEGYNQELTMDYEYEGKNRTYYPDIYIPGMNLILEIKSDYTYRKDEDKNIAKMNACVEQGYIPEIWIYNKNGERIDALSYF